MEEAYIYTDLNEVPIKWRTYKGARLSLSQINDIMSYAYSNKIELNDNFIPDYGNARLNLEVKYEIKNNFWVTKEEDL